MQPRIRKLILALFILLAGTSWSTITSAASNGRIQQLAESMLTDIHQASWIAEGTSPHVAYIFFDPNCPYCHKLFVSTRHWVKQGKVQLRWIPVGILMTTSQGKAVAMLGAEDPLKAFYQNEEHYDRSSGGGVDEDIATPDIERKLSANEKLLARTGFGAVPLMLFRTNKGEAILVQGSPSRDRLANLFEHLN